MFGIDLVARKQKQKREAKLRHDGYRLIDMDEAEHMGPKYGARQQQKHGLGNRATRNEGSEDRADEGRARDNSQRDKSHEKGSFRTFPLYPFWHAGICTRKSRKEPREKRQN